MLSNVSKTAEKISIYFKEHREQAFIAKAVMLATLMYLAADFIYGFLSLFVIFAPFYVFIFIWTYSIYKRESVFSIIKRNFTFIPVDYTEDGLIGEKIPWITYTLIIVNIFIHYHIYEYSSEESREFILDNFIFWPHTPEYWNVPISLISSMFMHGDYDHLVGNMLFLWVYGSVVEQYIGHKKLFWLYIVTGILAKLTFVAVELHMGDVPHSLGASGAISGIIGIYAVRCYFKTMVMPIPVLGIFSIFLPLNFKLRVNALFLVSSFFIYQFVSGLEYLDGDYLGIAFWSHIGGMFFGFAVAMKLGLNRDAEDDHLTEIGTNSLEENSGFDEGEESLREALSLNSENTEALLTLARIKSRRHGTKYLVKDEAIELYEKAIGLLIASNPSEAGNVFIEFNDKTLLGVEPSLQFKVAGALYRVGNLNRAGRAFEMLAVSPETPLDIKEKALFKSASVMEEMNLEDAAQFYYKQFLEEFPGSELAEKVRGKLIL